MYPGQKALVTGILSLIWILPLFSQVKIHKNLNIDDGLVYSQILMIHEDQQGYMWFGTSSGISRWDGISFKNFLLPEELSDNNFKWIVEFKDSTLVFATRKGIVQYQKDKFSAVPGAPAALNHWIHSLLVSEDNKLYVATDSSGLWIYDQHEFVNINRDLGLASNSVHALVEGADGTIYLGYSANSIDKLKNGTVAKIDLNKIPDDITINTLYEDENGALWIGTEEQGIYVHYQDQTIHIDQTDGLPSLTIEHITAGEDRQIIAATDEGMAVIESYSVREIINEQNGLSYNFIWFIKKDRNGIYYLGTDGGGVDIYRPGLFQTINQDCGLTNNTVWAICENREHEFYFGTDEGLIKYDHNQFQLYNTLNGLSDDMVLCLFEASDGKVYVGTNEQGVDVVGDRSITNINEKQGLHGPSVWTITEDNQGLIYFGTYDEGVNVWDGQRVVDTINVKDGLSTNAIVSSYRALDGSLYFGTDGGGVFKYINGMIDQVLLAGNTIWSIYEDQASNLYFGTNDRGLIFSRNGQWDTLSIDDGLSHNSILGILQDDEGKLYLTADNGLNVVDFSVNPYQIRVIGKSDGLASNECNQGAYFKDSQGYLWFGTINGVSRFDPKLCKPNPNAPVVHITKVQLFDKLIPKEVLRTNPVFNFNENYFNFEFIGIDLSSAQKVKYKYRLSGVDDSWKSTTHPSVQYTNLDDDDYTFDVKACNEWGYWSKPVTLNFTITAPFWERWWFILSAFLITISPAVVVIRQKIKRRLVLERLRAKIAADLHDDIGAGLSEINILSAVIVAKTPAEIKPLIENELNKIGQRARSLIGSMSDIVWLVNPKKDAVSDLVSRLKDSFSDLFEAKDILFKTENTDSLQSVHLEMEYRHNLFLLLKEGLHNAIKYSEANNITLSVKTDGKLLIISIKDDGKGFKTSQHSSGNGLINMQKRAEKIGGQLELNSSEGKGTQITFSGKI